MEEKNIDDIISECIDKNVNEIIKYYHITKDEDHEVSRIAEEEIKIDKDTNECARVIKKHSIYIPRDEYYRTLMFSLETPWVELEKHKLSPIFQDFNLSIEKYIYYDLIKKENMEKCAFEIKVEYNLKKIQYVDDNNKVVDFSYDIDEDIYDEYEEDSENFDNETRENIERFIKFCDFINQKIEDCGKFTILTLTNWISKEFKKNNIQEGGHRNVILIENTDSEIYFNHYEPHGSETDYLYEERKEFFEKLELFILKLRMKKDMKMIRIKSELSDINTKISSTKNSKKLKELKTRKNNLKNDLLDLKDHKIKKITIEPFSASYCIGIQTFLSEHDKYGYCSLFSFFWLYSILKCFFIIENKYNNAPPPMYTWVKNFEKILLEKFKNNEKKLYKLVIIFSYKLFSNLYSSKLVTETDKMFINIIQRGYSENIFEKYKKEIENKTKELHEKKIVENIDEKHCRKENKNIIEKDIIIDDFQEDEDIETNNTHFEKNNKIENEEDHFPPEYKDFDDEDRYKKVNNLSEEEKRRLLKEYYGEDFDLKIEEIENNEKDVVPRKYSYGDFDEDMEVEFVDEANQNEY